MSGKPYKVNILIYIWQLAFLYEYQCKILFEKGCRNDLTNQAGNAKKAEGYRFQ